MASIEEKQNRGTLTDNMINEMNALTGEIGMDFHVLDNSNTKNMNYERN